MQEAETMFKLQLSPDPPEHMNRISAFRNYILFESEKV